MKRKLALLYSLSFVSSLAPVGVYVGLNWDKYVHSVPAGGLRLTFGGLMVAVIVAMKVAGKLKLEGNLRWFIFGAALCWMLQAVLADLAVIFLLAASGEAADALFFQRTIKKIKEDKESDDLAEKIAERMRGTQNE